MRVAYLGQFDSSITRTWIAEMQARGVSALAIGVQQPSWDIEWAPATPKPPLVRGLGFGVRDLGRQIADACQAHSVDILHSHQVSDPAFWATESRIHPHVVTCWGSDVMRLDSQAIRRRFKVARTLKKADVITCGSKSLGTAAVSAGADASAVVLVGFGVDTRRFRVEPDLRERIRAEWGFSDRLVVLSTRKHEHLYRIDAIVRAFSAAHRRNPRLALVVASSGSLSQSLLELVRSLEIADSVKFLGSVPEEGWPTMPAVYAGGDIYASVPETDGGPISVLEAMAAELAVVASDIPVMREWVGEAGAGVLWNGESVESLADLFLRVLPSTRRLGAAGRTFVVDHHERAQEMDRARVLYDELARKS